MALTRGSLLQPQGLTTTERDLLTLAGADTGRLIFNETVNALQFWTGTEWKNLALDPPDASTLTKGVVQLADAAAVTAGTAGRVVDAAQLKVNYMPLDISLLTLLP